MNSIKDTGECLRPEKWQENAAFRCANKSMVLTNSLMTLDWCGMSQFRGIEFVCCPVPGNKLKIRYQNDKKNTDNHHLDKDGNNDYNTLNEDDPIPEPSIEPQTNLLASNRKIIATSASSCKIDI